MTENRSTKRPLGRTNYAAWIAKLNVGLLALIVLDAERTGLFTFTHAYVSSSVRKSSCRPFTLLHNSEFCHETRRALVPGRSTSAGQFSLSMGRTSSEDEFHDFDYNNNISNNNNKQRRSISRTRTSATRSSSTGTPRSNNSIPQEKGSSEEDDDADFYFNGSSEESVFKMNGSDEEYLGDYKEEEDSSPLSAASPSTDLPDSEDNYDEDSFDEPSITVDQAQSMTMPALKQQLRLRGLKVSGKKQDLIDRLLLAKGSSSSSTSSTRPIDSISSPQSQSSTTASKSPRDKVIDEQLGKKVVDVSDYIDVKAEGDGRDFDDQPSNEEEEGAEVWGSSAKVVMDNVASENPVVDNISRTVIEFKGFQNKKVQAYVSASRDALQSYLSGGRKNAESIRLSPAQQVAQQQQRREKAERQTMGSGSTGGEVQGTEDSDYKDGFYHVEDYSDVGLFTLTGAKKSAQEIEGILLLSDVKGFANDDTRALCDKIAFECQPCVVFCPDVFELHPWTEVESSGKNAEGEDYEQWRTNACEEERVTMDIRASAAVLRERYGVSSVVVFGTCFGGGRALEAASGWCPPGSYDPTKPVPPPPVHPSACIAWYPTRYKSPTLFGTNVSTRGNMQEVVPLLHMESARPFAVMAIFAGEDELSGATPEDAAQLRQALLDDPRVCDVMVKVFPNQGHGFAHNGLADKDRDGLPIGGADGEVASLLSTAWMETYSRSFLPTVGTKIKDEPSDSPWSQLEMPAVPSTEQGSTTTLPTMEDDDAWFDFASLTNEYEEHDYGRPGSATSNDSTSGTKQGQRPTPIKKEDSARDLVGSEDDDDDDFDFDMDDLDFDEDDDDSDLDPEMQRILAEIYDGLDALMEQEEEEEGQENP
jgi:dienelactone hydrolase